jgi:hypothetical protein
VARHVAACDACRGLAADLAAVTALLRSPALDPGPVPPPVADRLAGALRAAATPERREPGPASLDARRARRRWRTGLVAAAAVAGIAVVLPQVVQPRGGSDASIAGGAMDAQSAPPAAPPGSAATLARELVAGAATREEAGDETTGSGADGPERAPAVADLLAAGCGADLAEQLGARLVAAAPYEGSVVLVVDLPGSGFEYLVAPGCTAGVGDVVERGPVPP